MNPLDGIQVQAKTKDVGGKVQSSNLQTNFYLIAVPSYFTDASGRAFQVYQLTQNYISDYGAQ
jgi:hypothetical protein